MRDRYFDSTAEDELSRLKDILFPRKRRHTVSSESQIDDSTQSPTPTCMELPAVGMRGEIERLRRKINGMMEEPRQQRDECETERAYLDGINRLGRAFKNQTGEIQEAFDEFLGHLPTKQQAHIYSNQYYMTMLRQQVACHLVERVVKRPIVQVMQTIREKAQSRGEIIDQFIKIRLLRSKRQKVHNMTALGHFFHQWRYNNRCLAIGAHTKDYFNCNSLDHDARIIGSIMNLPELALLLEQEVRESADISQIIIVEERQEKGCKFIQQGQGGAHQASVDTITHRSIFDTPRETICVGRSQFDLTASLTLNCIHQAQISFINRMMVHPKYSTIDDACFAHNVGGKLIREQSHGSEQGAIFYPLFDSKQRCMGVLRQYFYGGNLKALSTQTLERLCSLLELGLGFDQQVKVLNREKQYQKQGYYMKMVDMLNNFQQVKLQSGNENLYGQVEHSLRQKMGVDQLGVWEVGQGGQNQWVLKCKYGSSEDGGALLLSLLPRLMQQPNLCLNLGDRVLFINDMTLFAMKIKKQSNSEGIKSAIFPAELVCRTLTKVEYILNYKTNEAKQLSIKQQERQDALQREETDQLQKHFREFTAKFIGNLHPQSSIHQILCSFLLGFHALHQPLTFLKCEPYSKPQIYLQCRQKTNKREKSYTLICQSESSPVGQKEITSILQKGQALSVEVSQLLRMVIVWVAPTSRLLLWQQLKQTLHSIIAKFISIKTKPFESFPICYANILATISSFEVPIAMSKAWMKKWQLQQIKHNYSHFSKAVNHFVTSLSSHGRQISWQRELPIQKNLEEWIKLIRCFANAPQESITAEITHPSPAMELGAKLKMSAITGKELSGMDQSSTLVIRHSSIAHQATSSSSILRIKIPLYYSSVHHCHEGIQQQIRTVCKIWLMICRRHQQNKLDVKQLLRTRGWNQMGSQINRICIRLLRPCLKMICRHEYAVNESLDACRQFMDHLVGFESKLVQKCFNRLQTTSIMKIQQRKEMYLSLAAQKSYSSALSHICYSWTFKKLIRFNQAVAKLQRGSELMIRSQQRQRKRAVFEAFPYLFYGTKQLNDTKRLCATIKGLLMKTYTIAMARIDLASNTKPALPSSAPNSNLQIRSLTGIWQYLNCMTPSSTLYLLKDSEPSSCLYSCEAIPPTPDSLPELIQLYPHALTYQTGAKGQLLWVYEVAYGQDCYEVKDKLNRITKTVEEALVKTTQQFENIGINLSSFKRNWLRKTMVKTWRKWQGQAQRLSVLQRNRLNDNLYQLSLQTQTMREKVKAQQKILKVNYTQYEGLKEKQNKHQESIESYQEAIKEINESGDKLQKVRGVSKALYRRSLLKNTMLLWRKKCVEIKVGQHQRQLRSYGLEARIGIRAIESALGSHFRRLLACSWCQLRNPACERLHKKVKISKDLQRLEVIFEEGSSDRLITFNDEKEKQNSGHNSNRSSSPDLSMKYCINLPSKLQMGSLKHQKKSLDLSAQELAKYGSGAYKLNPKTLKFLKRMGKLQQ